MYKTKDKNRTRI